MDIRTPPTTIIKGFRPTDEASAYPNCNCRQWSALANLRRRVKKCFEELRKRTTKVRTGSDGYSRVVTGAPIPAAFRAANALRVVVRDDFLPLQVRDEVASQILAREGEFVSSQVTLRSPTFAADESAAREPVIITRDSRERVTKDRGLRRSHVIEAPGQQLRTLFLPHLRRALVAAFGRMATAADPAGPKTQDQRTLEMKKIEVQLTASGDGDFYGLHADGGPNRYSHRDISFVYFVCTDPECFTGGELHLEGAGPEAAEQLIEPIDNRLVMFPSRRRHEICRVMVPSLEFRHSRFTVNGWVSLSDESSS